MDRKGEMTGQSDGMNDGGVLFGNNQKEPA